MDALADYGSETSETSSSSDDDVLYPKDTNDGSHNPPIALDAAKKMNHPSSEVPVDPEVFVAPDNTIERELKKARVEQQSLSIRTRQQHEKMVTEIVKIPRPLLLLSCCDDYSNGTTAMAGDGGNNDSNHNYAAADLTLFDKDYYSDYATNRSRYYKKSEEETNRSSSSVLPSPPSATTTTTTTTIPLEEKLDNLYRSLTNNDTNNTVDFASHLKKQKDFTNPSIYPRVIQYFQIDGAGSNLPRDIWDPNGSFKSFEFIEKLKASEERTARSRTE